MADSLSYEEQFCLAQKMPYRLWLVYTGREPASTGVEWEQARRSAMVAYPWPYLPPDIYADQDETTPDMTAAIRDVARGGG